MAVKLVDTQHIQDGIILGVVAADTKEDVTDNLKFGDNEMGLGSLALTTSSEIAICGSDDSWNWLED